jgi:hypothetical protein
VQGAPAGGGAAAPVRTCTLAALARDGGCAFARCAAIFSMTAEYCGVGANAAQSAASRAGLRHHDRQRRADGSAKMTESAAPDAGITFSIEASMSRAWESTAPSPDSEARDVVGVGAHAAHDNRELKAAMIQQPADSTHPHPHRAP